ncbi:MAG: MraY family glycosyltransferase [Desulfuromonadales bacterium]|nr:MraY family glycosyltransferase [Desulfuromonadales bacterium]
MNTLLIFMTALFTSLGLVPVLRRWALTTGTVDEPDERKVHKQAIPRLGGIAIYLSFLFAALVFIDGSREVRGILAGGLVVFVFGLIDDLYGLSPKRKFAGEITGVLVTIAVGQIYLSHLGNLFGFGDVVLPLWLAIAFTVFAVVGVINAINLIDGLDGLSGGVTVIALTTFMLLAYHEGHTEVMFLCAALLGAVIGFLKYNLYPARIFMGDAGSLSVGFVLGFLAVYLTQVPTSQVSPMTPVMVLGLPIIDAVWVMVRQVMKGNSPFSADMTHVHHKFLNLGFQHRFTVIVIYGISMFWSLVAIVARQWPEYVLLYGYLLLSMLLYGCLRYLINRRESFAFFAKDSAHGLRETRTYARLTIIAEKLVPLIFVLLSGYFALGLYVGIRGGENGFHPALYYFPLVAAAWCLRHRISRSLFQTLLYLGGLVVAYLVETAPFGTLPLGLTSFQIDVVLFSLLMSLVITKVLFRGQGEFFVSLVEIIVLAAGVFALVAFSQLKELTHLAHVPIHAGLLFLAIHIVFYGSRKRQESGIAVSDVKRSLSQTG